MKAKGRSRKGTPPRKLNERQALDICANYALCRVSKAALGRRYGITGRHVLTVVRKVSRRLKEAA